MVQWFRRLAVGPQRARWLALLFPLATFPFAAVHPPVRVLLVLLGAALVVLGRRNIPEQLPPGAWRLALVAAVALGVALLFLVPVGPFVRALLQPGYAPLVDGSLATIGRTYFPLALDPWRALLETAVLALGITIVLAGTTAFHDERWRQAEPILVATAIGVLLLEGIQRATEADAIYGISGIPTPVLRPFFGPFVDANHGGALCAAIVPLAVARGVERQNVLHWIAGLVVAVGVALSASRGAVIGLGVGIWALVLVLLPNPLALIGVVGSVGAVCALLLWDAERALGMLNAVVDPETVRNVAHGWADTWGGRQTMYADAIDLIPKAPVLGSGAGSFGDVYPLVKSTPLYVDVRHAHQELLEVTVEHGIFGLAMAAFVGGLVIQRVLVALAADPGYRLRSEMGGPLGTLAALGAVSMAEFPLRTGSLFVLAALVTGRILSFERTRRAAGGHRLVVGFAVAAGVLAILAGLLARAPVPTYGPASAALAAGAEAEAERDWSAARAAYARAVGRGPLSGDALSRYGRAALRTGDTSGFQALTLATTLDPSRPTTWMRLADALAAVGEWQASRDAWREALALDLPSSVDAAALLERAMAGPGEDLGKALAIAPERSDRCIEIARWLDRRGLSLEAEVLFRKAMAIDPDAQLELAGAHLDWGMPSEALALAQPYVQKCSGARVAAKALVRLRRASEGVTVLESARKRGCRGEQFLRDLEDARAAAERQR
jgi:tetratricopeptide (TPR) repeat protein/O-antigen ligase